MGKPSDKDWFRGAAGAGFARGMGLSEEQEQIKEMLDRYGVDGSRSVKPENRGVAPEGRDHREYDEVKADLQKAMMNDYDTRRGMEAAALSGDNKARKFAEGGISEGNMYRAYDHLKDLKKEHVGGGSMIGPENEAGLTMALVDHEREKQTEGYEEQFASQDFLEKKLKEYEDKFSTMQEGNEPADYQESEELQQARQTLADKDKYTFNSEALFNKQNESAPVRDNANTAAGSYLEQYKKDMIKGGKIGEAKTDNLNNALNTVTNEII